MAEISRRLTPTDAYKEEMRKLVEEEGIDKKFIFSHEQVLIDSSAKIGAGPRYELFCGCLLQSNRRNAVCRVRLFLNNSSQARQQFLHQANLLLNHPALRDHPQLEKILGVSVSNEEDPTKIRLMILERKPDVDLDWLDNWCSE